MCLYQTLRSIVAECYEMLAHTEDTLLAFPNRSVGKDTVERMICAVHVIKESTLLFNIEPASRLVSHMEETLNLIREDIFPLDREQAFLLMLCCDYIDELLNQYALQSGYFLPENLQAMEESLIYRLWHSLNRKTRQPLAVHWVRM
jgi:chemotaxis protein histidine kinase CheA